jgi:amino acid adenylation domain-containing protein
MTLVELLSTLRTRDINLWAEGERLRYSAPSGALTPDIREELSKYKADLLAFLSETERVRRVTRAPISRISREGKLLPSINQRRLWFIDQLEPNTAFNCYTAFRIKGSLNIESLEESLNEIVRRHEVLRTTFSVIDGEPFQVINPALKFRLTLIDLRDIVDATERETGAERIMTEEVERPFDLAKGPLFRAHLLCLSTDEHLLLITMHHILTDGWSMGILVKELTALYEARCKGNPSPLPELPIQYVDFAHWQSQWLQGEVFQQELSYWKERLNCAPKVTELLTDYPRPAVQNFKGASEPVVISKSLTGALKTLSKNQGFTLFMTLLAAFKTLLYRYTGQEDLVLGSPIAGRIRGDIENLIGLFINTLVLRTDLSGNPTFRELLRRVREVALEAYAHQEVPFEKLIEDLQLGRSRSFTSLFQVMFVLQNTPEFELKLLGSTVNPVTIKRETALFDLFLSLAERDERLHGTLSYRTDLFDRVTISHLIRRFQVLLHGIVADPDRPISTLPLLMETEKHQLLVEWNGTKKGYPKDQCLPQLFEEQVERTPDAVAVIFGDQRLTYRELNEQANQLARYLRKLGVGPEVLVGICIERSLEMVVGLLGIHKAGGAYVPLNPQYPMERLAFMLQDTHAPVLLTQQRLIEARRDSNPRFSIPVLSPSAPLRMNSVEGLDSQLKVICLDSEWEVVARESEENPRVDVSADHLAYVIYTSGSTGQPKGVLVTHGNMVNHSLAVADLFALQPEDRVSQCNLLSFDISVEELFSSWISGAAVILCPPEKFLPDEEFANWIARDEITVLNLPTAFWHKWVDALDTRQKHVSARLRLVVCGGDKAAAHVLAKWQTLAAPQVLWINTYGPTEATVTTTVYNEPFCPVMEKDSQEIPIGRPIAGAQVYILDRGLQPVPIGVPGELYIGGAGLARGYLNRPEITSESFIPNPFSQQPGTRLYRTGDSCRYLPDGNIEFLGRIDHQVKIRGFRIELGEIESTINQHPGVQGSVTIVREDVAGDKRLVAYVVPRQEGAPTINELRSFVKQKLPEYMVPSAFVFLDSLPLTSNGKVDRQALPVPSQNRAELEESFVAPRTPTEEMLAGIWAELLHVEQVGIHDSFFDLGGHSLLATQVVSKLRETFGVDLPLRFLFDAPTVAGLAERIETARRSEQGLTAPPMERVSRDGDLPLSFAQQRLWFLDQLMPGSIAYNMSGAVRLTGPLNVVALEQSLTEVLRRHEILRTTFRAVDGQPFQSIAPAKPFILPVTDLEPLPEAEREAEARRLAIEEAHRLFDLARGPLFRATLLRLGEEDHILQCAMHHAVSDGWSIAIFNKEIGLLYHSFSTGQPLLLPELPIQYADFAHWQRQWLQGEVLEAQLNYWRKQLAGAPPSLELPTDRARPAVQTFHGARQSLVLPKSLTEALKGLSRQEGVTLFMTLLAAFKVLLSRYTGQEDIVVGTPIAGRNRAEIEPLIGFFINTVALRTDLSGGPSFRELLRRVREVALGAYDHQEMPFEKLVEELQPERDLSRTPLFQVFFNMLNLESLESHRPELNGLTAEQVVLLEADSKFDLTFYARERNEEIHLTLVYNADLFDTATISGMLSCFQNLLDEIVTKPEQPIANLPLWNDPEKEQLIDDFNQDLTRAYVDTR